MNIHFIDTAFTISLMLLVETKVQGLNQARGSSSTD
jgi:hypothetical protein